MKHLQLFESYNSKLESILHKLGELGLSIVPGESLSIPIRKSDWMYPKEFVIFKIEAADKLVFALYKSDTSTSVKRKGGWYITPVVQEKGGYPKSLAVYWTEGKIHSIPELAQDEHVSSIGHYLVDGRTLEKDLTKFISNFD